MASVAFQGVGKAYPGGVRALLDLCLEVEDGELLVFVGPSGCGKSTVLRLLAGLEEPSEGSLWIGGRRVDALSPQERNVAMVFQDYALYPFLSVRGNLEFPLKMRRTPRAEIEMRVQRTAEMLGMQDWLDRLPRQLSGGQRQRVAMGRALVREPSVFLMDEPLSNLDARTRTRVRDEIGELQRRTRTTTIYVTHDQTEAMTLGQRVAVLEAGRLQQLGTAQEIYERPANLFVAGFIGSPPMNLLPARIAEGPAGWPLLEVGEARLPVAPAALGGSPGSLVGAPVTAGIRPEALRLAGAGEAGSLGARVEGIEQLGHETLVHARIEGLPGDGGGQVVVRIEGMRALGRGEPLRLVADPEQIHLFGAGGRALAGAAG